MRLLLITEGFESPKRSNSTFKWLGKFLKDELMLDMSIKRDLQAFSKLRQRRKKCSLSSTSKLQLHKEFKVSRKLCLNLCLFKGLKRRRNLVKYLTLPGSSTLNIDIDPSHKFFPWEVAKKFHSALIPKSYTWKIRFAKFL